MNYLFIVAGVLIGCIVGMFVQRTIHKKTTKPIGTIRVDHSDPTDPPYLFLELSKPMDELYESKYVTLEVQIKNYISQK